SRPGYIASADPQESHSTTEFGLSGLTVPGTGLFEQMGISPTLFVVTCSTANLCQPLIEPEVRRIKLDCFFTSRQSATGFTQLTQRLRIAPPHGCIPGLNLEVFLERFASSFVSPQALLQDRHRPKRQFSIGIN